MSPCPKFLIAIASAALATLSALPAAAQVVNTVDVTGYEIAGGEIAFPVALSAAPPTPVTVSWSVADGSASHPADYGGPTGGTLTFLPGGPLAQFVRIPIVTDAVNDPDETVIFSLSSPSAGLAIGNGTATGTILQSPRLCIAVTFVFDAGPHGVIDPSPDDNRRCSDESRTLRLVADPGYRIAGVTGCNGLLANDIYVVPPGPDCTITATFAPAPAAVGQPVPGPIGKTAMLLSALLIIAAAPALHRRAAGWPASDN